MAFRGAFWELRGGMTGGLGRSTETREPLTEFRGALTGFRQSLTELRGGMTDGLGRSTELREPLTELREALTETLGSLAEQQESPPAYISIISPIPIIFNVLYHTIKPLPIGCVLAQ